MPDVDWAPELVTQLRTLREGGVSMSQIGNALGISRSAVAGKLRRLGIPAPTRQGTRIDLGKVKEPKPAPVPVVAPPPAPIVFADACEPVAMQALRYLGQCKWSVSDGLFCGREAKTVWCDAHKRVVFQPQKRA